MPDFRSMIRERLEGTGLAPETEQAIVEELTQHVEDRYRDLIARGVPEAEALDRGLREVDGHDVIVRELKRSAPARPADPSGMASSGSWLSGLWQDVRYAARTLRRTPGFTVAAVLTVAICTGPTIGALGVANWLLLRPVPGVAGGDRLATVDYGVPRGNGAYSVSRVAYAHLNEFLRVSSSVEAMAGWQATSVSLAAGERDSRVVRGQFVTANFFAVLGVRLEAGRTFHDDEDASPGGAPVVILSERTASDLFDDAARAVGQTVRLNGYAFTVVGVAPAEFPGAVRRRPVQLWMTGLTTPRLSHQAPEDWAFSPDRGPFYHYIARIADGATFDQAQTELLAAARGLAERDPDGEKYSEVEPMLSPGMDVAQSSLRSSTQALVGVGIVLLILGVANLANLFLFRAARRAHETGVRRALGASASRLARLHLAETMLVAVAGGALGVASLVAADGPVSLYLAQGTGTSSSPFVDVRLWAIAAGVLLFVGLALGLAPARVAARAGLAGVLNQATRSGAHMSKRIRSTLAVTQLVLSLTLLIGALLFVATLRNLQSVDPGFDASGVSTYRFGFNLLGYDEDRILGFYRSLTDVLERSSFVDEVGIGDGTPMLGGGTGTPIEMPGAAGGGAAGGGEASSFRGSAVDVTPGYFAALGIRLTAGRTFGEDDVFRPGVEAAVVVSETLARQLYGTPDVLGRTVTFGATAMGPRRDVPIVGVARDVQFDDVTATLAPVVYRPLLRARGFNDIVIVRSSAPAADVAALVESTVGTIAPNLPVTMSQELAIAVDLRLQDERLAAWVFGSLAAIGFLLAAIGIHGLISQAAVERNREFGIRLAIGATRAEVMRLVLRSALQLVLIGAPLGLVAAAWLSGFAESRLFGVTPGDPGVYVVATLSLLAVVLLAASVPAVRASRADPVDVLRE